MASDSVVQVEAPQGGLRADLRQMLSEQPAFWQLTASLVRRDLSLRYRNAVFGFGWAVAMPVLHTLIFWVIFTRVVPFRTDLPYPVYAYTGLLGWNLLASSLRFSVTSLSANPNLVTKVYFAREVLPFSAVMVACVDFAVAAVVLAAMMLFYGVAPSWTLVFIPLIFGVQVMLTAGLSLLVAMTNLFYTDTKYILELVLTVGMFATSVVIPVERAAGTLGMLLRMNPITQILNAYRSVLRAQVPDLAALGVTAAFSLAVLMVCWLVFHRAEFRFAEEV
jgi:ABC-type polysaccharide/polyol phosphate export permease